jgi:poly(hydroxyalkanoate) depolymerase family esterase
MTAPTPNHHKEPMDPNFEQLMRDATRLTQAGQLGEATAAIQRALGVTARAAAADMNMNTDADAVVLDGCVVELPAERDVPATGEFSAGSHTHAALTRNYKLYVPPDAAGRALPLVVMLHGCTQNPDDFAAGTGMNARARAQGFFVLYPEQAQDANPSRCWNWFKHNHQRRERGEAAVIATMTQAVVRANGIDPERVYIAGLSAGGAMAAQVACAYPELFAAAGVHSGLPPGAARSLPEGLAAMKAGPGEQPPTAMPIPVIVFHGDGDATVHPRNGAAVVDAVLRSGLASPAPTAAAVEPGASRDGERSTRTLWRAANGDVIAEHWLVHGGGHAWFGGNSAGSYTDARGPDASGEMLRFFLARRRRADLAG